MWKINVFQRRLCLQMVYILNVLLLNKITHRNYVLEKYLFAFHIFVFPSFQSNKTSLVSTNILIRYVA